MLNYTQLSNETGAERELVEGAVREVLQALSRAVAAKKTVEFDLKDIGRSVFHHIFSIIHIYHHCLNE